MGDKTGIEWCDATWNPTTGCDKVSPGCDNCYALTLAPRLKAMGSAHYQTDGDPVTSGPGFGIAMHPDGLDKPLRWTRPRRIFVNSMSDLFHAGVTREFQAEVFAVMALARQHTFQVLTKRPGVMRSVLSSLRFHEQVQEAIGTRLAAGTLRGAVAETVRSRNAKWLPLTPAWPLPNVWLGTSVEDQKRADLRIPALLDTPAAVRFLSMEPLLGPVDLTRIERVAWSPARSVLAEVRDRDSHALLVPSLDWVIVGGESGPGSRPMDVEWVRDLREQCTRAGVAFHFKQWGSHDWSGQPIHKKEAGRVLDGRTWDEWPEADRG